MKEQKDIERIIRYSSVGFIAAISLLIAWVLMSILGVSQAIVWWIVLFLAVIAVFFAIDYVSMFIMWIAVKLGILD
ncbi:MAG: hypothetical protein AMJ88_06775 [Anaerolineae bacterium SM23_ 63]|nr:MAG: hypothetical protein AMJ88_06775 [Anaerolineae bacterium SM23_ 63]HEY46837.1 hypothetical protein [Anaerolineae bacterium]